MILHLPGLLDARALAFVDEVLGRAVFNDGALTAGPAAKHLKRNQELDRKRTPGAAEIERLVVAALSANRDFQDFALPQGFSRPIVSRYEPGMEYGRHVDNPILSSGGQSLRTDVSVTIFLSDPADYDGGALIHVVDGIEREYKPARGDAVAYTTGTPHRVSEVTRGARVAAILWAQSIVADPHRRGILTGFHKVHHMLSEQRPDAPETEMFLESYYNLVRLWAQM